MDPCPFVRLTVGSLALKTPVAAKPARSAVHPSSSPCFCVIELKTFPRQSAAVPYIPPDKAQIPDGNPNAAATFHLSKSDLDKLTGKPSMFSTFKKPRLKVSVYSGSSGATCGVSSGRLLGKISVNLDLAAAGSKPVVFHNGWINLGKGTKSVAQFHLNVTAEPDPRFVFQFDGAPECSPQIFQIRGNVPQPVFTCKFGFRSADRHQRSRSLPPNRNGGNARTRWLGSFGSERERPGKERKGWSITIHDLSGSPVAAASMVTPFVASPGSDRVSRSSPGCWLILRPGNSTWKPWGRLEAWSERGSSDGLGYRFEVIPDSAGASGIVLAESTLSCSKGGKLTVDLGGSGGSGRRSTGPSPGCSPKGSGDFGNGLWPYCHYKGFVVRASVGGEGKNGKGVGPMVEVGVQQVGCSEDAAAFVALAAALDMSVDACSPFSQKLCKELCRTPDI